MKLRIISTLIITLALLAFVSACSRSDSPAPPAAVDEAAAPAAASISHVDAAEAAALLAGDPSVVVLDVRTPGEFADAHIPGAVNVDFRASTFKDEAGKLDKTKPYLVHCQSGGRSTSSLEVLESLGFEKIYHLDGGFGDWEKAGNPIEE